MQEKTIVDAFPDFLKTKELAQILRVPISTIRGRSWLAANKLNPYKIGSQLRFDLAEVQEMLARSRIDRSLEQ